MSRSRCLLHRNKLQAFRRFCEERGWVVEPNKGAYDALRLRHPEVRDPVIVYTRGHAPQHLTVYGTGFKLVLAFQDAQRRVK